MSVLIVDDEEQILKAIENHLALDGIECQTALSAKQGLELHRESLFPVVLSDIRMPEMDGMDLVREVKKIHPTCIIFMMTGYSSMQYLLKCFELGASDYFTKPFENLDSIINRIKEALARSERWKTDLLKAQQSNGG